MAEQVARASRDFQQQRTGHAPAAVTVVLSNDTLVITLHEALTPAERALAQNATGAVVQVFTSGTMVQVLQLAEPITTRMWNSE